MEGGQQLGKEDLLFAIRYLAQKAQRLTESIEVSRTTLDPTWERITHDTWERIIHDVAMLKGAAVVALDVAAQVEEEP